MKHYKNIYKIDHIISSVIVEMFETNDYIVSWDQSKYLTASSFLFIIPGIYAYYKGLHFIYSTLLFATSFISANYWCKATYSWRRNLDLAIAKVSFTFFATNGIVYVNYIPYVITGYIGMATLIYCYYLSGTLFEQKNENWWKYHMLFHFLMAGVLFIILESVRI